MLTSGTQEADRQRDIILFRTHLVFPKSHQSLNNSSNVKNVATEVQGKLLSVRPYARSGLIMAMQISCRSAEEGDHQQRLPGGTRQACQSSSAVW